MKKYIPFVLVFIVFLGVQGDAGNGDFEAFMQKYQPFIGKWKTRSVYPDSGLEVPGVIEYRRVLGGNWVYIEFKGDHPKRPFWEAYVMIQYRPGQKCYVSHAFYGAQGPTLMTGRWLSVSTIGFEMQTDNRRSGIDYTVQKDGTVYQENWRIDENGKRQITLQTYYTRIK